MQAWLLILLSILLALVWERLSHGAGRLLFAGGGSLLLLLILAVGAAAAEGMVAVSAVCWLGIGSLFSYGVFHTTGTHQLRFGVLPIWAYDAQRACATEANSRILALFAALQLLLAWCALAGYTQLPMRCGPGCPG